MPMFKVANDYKKKKKLQIKFDIRVLNMIIGYIFKETIKITKKSLKNLNTLFSKIDTSIYSNNAQLSARVTFIQNALDAKFNRRFESEDAVVSFCLGDIPDEETLNIVHQLPAYKKINLEEMKYIDKCVEDRLTYAHILEYKDVMYNTIERIDSGDFKSFKDINDDFANLCSSFLTGARKIKNISTDNRLSLTDDNFDEKILTNVSKIKNPSRCFQTGIKALNKMLGGIGYESGRCYYYCGTPGGFKSGLLLKSVVDGKYYNSKSYKPKKPGAIPTILYLSLENSMTETIERLFNMTVTGTNIRDFTPNQVLKMLKEDGHMCLNGENDICIDIQYYGNMEIDTGDIYSIVDELESSGKEVIMIVVDYLKRIRSVAPAKDTKEQLKNVTNEFHDMAIYLDLPIVSAHQVNRDGAATIDAGMQSNKTDLAKFLGRGNVSEAWEVYENADFFAFINKEMKKDTKQFFLTFFRSKNRGRETDMRYFNHPFAQDNQMDLISDINLDKSLSIESLSSDFEGVVEFSNKKGKRNAKDREIIDDDNNSSLKDVFDMEALLT